MQDQFAIVQGFIFTIFRLLKIWGLDTQQSYYRFSNYISLIKCCMACRRTKTEPPAEHHPSSMPNQIMDAATLESLTTNYYKKVMLCNNSIIVADYLNSVILTFTVISG